MSDRVLRSKIYRTNAESCVCASRQSQLVVVRQAGWGDWRSREPRWSL